MTATTEWRAATTEALTNLAAALQQVGTDTTYLRAAIDQVASNQVALGAQLDQVLALLQPPPPPAPRFAGDPGPGQLYYGESREGGDPTDRELYAGHVVGTFRSYFDAGQVQYSFERVARDLSLGRLPLISYKLPGPWANVAAGIHDTWLRSILGGLAGMDGPVWLCLHHEPWDDQGDGCTPTDYRAMYQHVWPMLPANVALVPILQSGPFDPAGQQFSGAVLTDWIDPAACHVIGYDIYNHWHDEARAPGHFWHWRDVPAMLAFSDTVAAAFPGLPHAICEYGTRVDPTSPGKAAAWMTDYRAGLLARGDVVAMSLFDSGLNVNDGGTPWTLDDNGDTERLTAFAQLLTATGSAFRSSH